jgi:hypothetical protein
VKFELSTNDACAFYVISLYLNMNNIAWLYYTVLETLA